MCRIALQLVRSRTTQPSGHCLPCGRLSVSPQPSWSCDSRQRTDAISACVCLQLITQYQADEYELAAALAAHNQAKNRSPQFVSPERWRVHLSPRPGVEGSDYINATALIGGEVYWTGTEVEIWTSRRRYTGRSTRRSNTDSHQADQAGILRDRGKTPRQVTDSRKVSKFNDLKW